MRILVVEDDRKIAGFIERGLKEERYIVDVARNGEQAIVLAQSLNFDLILLDIILPDIDGVEVCRELRKTKSTVPIFMITAKDLVSDKVKGLDAGADDYLTKPFAFEELLARIRALLRRKNGRSENILTIGDLELDQIAHRVSRAGKEIELTGKEYALLEYLMLNADRIVTRTMISEHVWHENFDTFTNVIDVYIGYLRKKIDRGWDKKLIQTIRGMGYRMRG
jgi:DNA-binding response OmpR family regulator